MSIFPLRCRKLQENLTKLYSLVWGHFYDNLKAELPDVDNLEKKIKTYDVVCLISNLKKITAGMDKSINVYAGLLQKSSHYSP